MNKGSNNQESAGKIKEEIKHALDKLVEKDFYLLQGNVNERTITHRLAIYLEDKFKCWNVDCEYNRVFGEEGFFQKKVEFEAEDIKSNDTEARTVYPDIIIHHRGTAENHIAIEVKKDYGGTNSKECKKDKAKLEAYKSQLEYEYAFFIKIKTDLKEKKITKPLNCYYEIEP